MSTKSSGGWRNRTNNIRCWTSFQEGGLIDGVDGSSALRREKKESESHRWPIELHERHVQEERLSGGRHRL